MIIKAEGTVTFEDGTTAPFSIEGAPAVAAVEAVEAVPQGAVDFSTIPTEHVG
jgi:hypothetical protein